MRQASLGQRFLHPRLQSVSEMLDTQLSLVLISLQHQEDSVALSLPNLVGEVGLWDSRDEMMNVFKVKVENNAIGKDGGKVSKHAAEERRR